MAQKPYFELCQRCYDGLSEKTRVVFAGGKVRRATCENCGGKKKTARYVVEDPALVGPVVLPSAPRSPKPTISPERREQLRKNAPKRRSDPKIDVDKLMEATKVVVTVEIDSRTFDRISTWSEQWGIPFGRTIDEVVRQFRNMKKREMERNGYSHTKAH